MQKLSKDRTRVKISKLHIYQEGKHCHYFYSYNLRYNAIFTFYYNFLDIVLCLPSKYLLKILFSLGNLTLLTHFPQMSIEQRLQGCPLQNNPNLLFMHEKQSRPWDTDGGKPWWGGNKVKYFQVQIQALPPTRPWWGRSWCAWPPPGWGWECPPPPSCSPSSSPPPPPAPPPLRFQRHLPPWKRFWKPFRFAAIPLFSHLLVKIEQLTHRHKIWLDQFSSCRAFILLQLRTFKGNTLSKCGYMHAAISDPPSYN